MNVFWNTALWDAGIQTLGMYSTFSELHWIQVGGGSSLTCTSYCTCLSPGSKTRRTVDKQRKKKSRKGATLHPILKLEASEFHGYRWIPGMSCISMNSAISWMPWISIESINSNGNYDIRGSHGISKDRFGIHGNVIIHESMDSMNVVDSMKIHGIPWSMVPCASTWLQIYVELYATHHERMLIGKAAATSETWRNSVCF